MGKDPASSLRFLDPIGMIVSLGCGLHCLALTLAFVFYPTLWLNRKLWESGLITRLLWMELGLLILAWILVLLAFAAGWRRHRRRTPLLIALVGLALLTTAIRTQLHFMDYWGSLTALVGGLLLFWAHWLNFRAPPIRS